jgi:hypothetical protein
MTRKEVVFIVWSTVCLFIATVLVARDLLSLGIFTATLLAVVISGIYLMGFLAFLHRLAERPRDTSASVLEEVRQIPLDEAVKQAELLLSDPARFQCSESPLARDGAAASGLPRTARTFFERYDRVASLFSGTELARDEIGPSTVAPGFTRVGNETEHTEVAVKTGEDTVYILADDVPTEIVIESTYPTLYHYIIAIDRLWVG